MKLKIIIFLAIILTSCETTNKKVITNKDFKNYSNDGFALIFNNDIFKKRIVSKKIDQRSLVIFNNKLKKDTDIKITNLLNEKYLIAKVGKNSKYPIFYNSVISERIAPMNHSQYAASIIRPYVSEKTYWIILHHGLFQTYYSAHHLGGDRNARDKFKDHKYYQDTVDFCEKYDQSSFDPNYKSMSLEDFEPMVKKIFDRKPFYHH